MATPKGLTKAEWEFAKKGLKVSKQKQIEIAINKDDNNSLILINRIKGAYAFYVDRPYILQLFDMVAYIHGTTPAGYVPPLRFSNTDLENEKVNIDFKRDAIRPN